MERNNKTIIFIDWDDTIFPTTWYTNHKNVLSNVDSILKTYDSKIYLLLSKIVKLSKVYIITNASLGWIYKSSELIPKTHGLMIKSIKVISAKDKYMKEFPSDPNMWKQKCFEKLVDSKYNNYISIGDSEYEKLALVNLYKTRKNMYFKTIKFVERPEILQLYAQVHILINDIEYIIEQKQHNDLIYNDTKK